MVISKATSLVSAVSLISPSAQAPVRDSRRGASPKTATCNRLSLDYCCVHLRRFDGSAGVLPDRRILKP